MRGRARARAHFMHSRLRGLNANAKSRSREGRHEAEICSTDARARVERDWARALAPVLRCRLPSRLSSRPSRLRVRICPRKFEMIFFCASRDGKLAISRDFKSSKMIQKILVLGAGSAGLLAAISIN